MIHKFIQKGCCIVLDTNSGAVHIVDKLVFLLLDYLKPPFTNMPGDIYAKLSEYSIEDIEEAFSEIKELYVQELLFSSDDYGAYAEKITLSPIKAMCLNVSHDCNLRCEYCFAGKGDYSRGREVMSAETGKAAIDFLIVHSEGRKNLEVDFFGGEPLLNFGVVLEVIKYAREKEKEHDKNFRFTITTNGLLLDDEKISFINREMDNVVLSLDGRRHVNDKVRKRADGRGCFSDVMPKLKRLVEGRGDKEYYVRGTFTRYNLDFGKDVEYLNNLGFGQISIEPVVASYDKPYALTDVDLPVIFEEYERLANTLISIKQKGGGCNFFHFMLDLEQGPCVIKRIRGCGCGNEYVAVTPGGDIYPCHQFIGHDEWKMGSLNDGCLDLDIKKYFSKASVYKKDDCRECWAKFYCGGGCCANNMIYEGDALKPHKISCELEKKRLECAIAMKARLSEDAV